MESVCIIGGYKFGLPEVKIISAHNTACDPHEFVGMKKSLQLEAKLDSIKV
jgi:hypothetical protein